MKFPGAAVFSGEEILIPAFMLRETARDVRFSVCDIAAGSGGIAGRDGEERAACEGADGGGCEEAGAEEVDCGGGEAEQAEADEGDESGHEQEERQRSEEVGR